MNKKLFVSFVATKGNNNHYFFNGVMKNFKEPKSFEDIEKIEKGIIEELKKKHVGVKVTLLSWNVMNQEDELQDIQSIIQENKERQEDERKNSKNERIGYFTK